MAGAPTKYNEEYNEQVYKICLLGATDKDLADFFNVCEATINNWKNDYPGFLESIKRGKQIADANVADRLYQRALGFEHDSEEIKVIEGSVERVPVKKVYPPDPTSAIFWLKNRQPERWRDKQDVETNGNLNINWNEEKTYE
ncbi:terminase [Chryseobacterium gallinarum]|uniref:Terminase n=1 Tax=Chryseobacterium gallinarum TaxID=1324352 RepID=A0ABX6KUR5_CHRGL|nr:terminase [Chryseobacterium gallinarum]QIY92232.1 terminase [Chryseobacterium gallinarum]